MCQFPGNKSPPPLYLAGWLSIVLQGKPWGRQDSDLCDDDILRQFFLSVLKPRHVKSSTLTLHLRGPRSGESPPVKNWHKHHLHQLPRFAQDHLTRPMIQFWEIITLDCTSQRHTLVWFLWSWSAYAPGKETIALRFAYIHKMQSFILNQLRGEIFTTLP